MDDEWGVSENRAAGNWISVPQFDATFDGALTRSMIDIYERFYNFSIQNVHSGGAGNAELAAVLAESGYEVTAVDKDARTVARLSRSETPDGLTISEGGYSQSGRNGIVRPLLPRQCTTGVGRTGVRRLSGRLPLSRFYRYTGVSQTGRACVYSSTEPREHA